jgi:predicted alpha/beta-fold hydrolase
MSASEFKPAWWLPSPHLQTLWPVFFRRHRHLPMRRDRLELDDGDFVDLCWSDVEGPLVLIVHGLQGSIHSHYAGTMIAALERAGFRPVFMHFRGCSGEPNRLPRSYHSGDTGDMRSVVDYLRMKQGVDVFAAVGFSLGGNALLKWLGQQGRDVPLQCAAAVSVPFVLADAADRLRNGVSRLYEAHLLRSLRQSYKDKFALMPSPLDVNVEKLRTFREFDHEVTAPLHGFDSVDHYYGDSSCRRYLTGIAIPTRIVHSRDDPFVYPSTVPTGSELSSMIDLVVTSRGGHVGFVSGNNPFRPRYWHEQAVCEFLVNQRSLQS